MAKKSVMTVDQWEDHEVFTAKGSKIGKSRVSILDTSTILFNAGFVHAAKISTFSHVILGFSSQNNAITFQFTNDDKAEGSIPIQHRAGGASIGSVSYFNYFALVAKDIAGRYEPKKVKISKIGDAYMIDITKKVDD